MADEPVFVFLATYTEEASAREDLDALRTLHAQGLVRTATFRPSMPRPPVASTELQLG